jgi:hypothetical protein
MKLIILWEGAYNAWVERIGKAMNPGTAIEAMTASRNSWRVAKVPTVRKPSNGQEFMWTCMRPEAIIWMSGGVKRSRSARTESSCLQ